VGKQDIAALHLGVGIAANEDNGRPWVKLAGNIHGDEPSGRYVARPNATGTRSYPTITMLSSLCRQLLLVLAEQLCQQYVNNATDVVNLLSTANIAIIPTLNPDGFDQRRRENK
jgi:hypothetical protein